MLYEFIVAYFTFISLCNALCRKGSTDDNLFIRYLTFVY